MQFIKKLRQIFLLSFMTCALIACHKTTDPNALKVGTIAGPETELMMVAQQVAEKKAGLKIVIVPFTDYAIPNAALADGSIDANMFQHEAYLKEAITKRQYKIVAVAKTFIYPMGIYSAKIKNLAQLPEGAKLAIPNDTTNEGRALLLLQSAKLLTLKNGKSTSATPADIISNPKNLKFKEIDASQLPRTLADVDSAVINTNYAMMAGLLPSKDALFVEKASSPYANLLVVRQSSEHDKRIKQLVSALHSAEVVEKAKELFKDQAIAAWK
jgi:D-methionine transport system substrate-binding protein